MSRSVQLYPVLSSSRLTLSLSPACDDREIDVYLDGRAGSACEAKDRLLLRTAHEVCVCVFIKLHITTQSGPVILVILCHSH